MATTVLKYMVQFQRKLALEANQGASVHAADTVYDPGGVRTPCGSQVAATSHGH